jgi:hypothetical protein
MWVLDEEWVRIGVVLGRLNRGFGRVEGAARNLCTQGSRPGLSHSNELCSSGTPAG